METPRAVLRPYFPLAAGVLINLSIGILYAWSVFVEPLEAHLQVGRATVSGTQSICVLTATIGTFAMHRMLNWLTMPQLALVMAAMSAAGLVLAGFGQSVAALYVGYGILHGFATGILYFVAMTAASIDGPVRPSIAMSINIAAVASGGIVWAPCLTMVIDAVGLGPAFAIGAAVIFAASALGALLLIFSRKAPPPATGATGLFEDILTDRPRVVTAIFVGFFFIAFTMLVVIAHAATLLVSWGATAGQAQLGPMLASTGYVAGALLGGPLVDALTGRRVLAVVSFVAGVFLLALFFAPGIAMGLVTIGMVGACLGVLGTAHPITIAGYYGAAAMPRIYGRVAIAYGFGGLLGPFTAGAIYDMEQQYSTVVILIAVLAFAAAASYAALPGRERRGAPAERAV